MDNLGEYLKRERERKGLTIEEVSKITRIGKEYIKAIEDGKFEIQSPVFMKGFLRSYAQFLGLDTTDVIERYTREMHPEKEREIVPETKGAAAQRSYGKYLLSGLIAAAILLLLIVTSLFKSKEPEPAIEPVTRVFEAETTLGNLTTHELQKTAVEKPFKPLTTIVPPVKPAPAQPVKPVPTETVKPAPAQPVKPVPTETVKPAPAQPVKPVPTEPVKPVMKPQTAEQPQKKYTLAITAKEITWLRITVDDRTPFEVLLRKGETASWTADKKITVVSGNAGGTELTLNGEPLGVMGEPGKVVTKVLPK